MKKILRGPWTEQEMERPVSSNLTVKCYEALTLPIVEAERELQRVGGPFKTSGNVLPIHCKNALNALGELKENVTVASQNLHYADSFAVILSSSRYPLLTILYTIQERASQLIDQLDTYRFACLKPSRHVQQQQREIVSQLEDISRQLADIPELVKSLNEDVEIAITTDQSPSELYVIGDASTGKSSSKVSLSSRKRRSTNSGR